MAKIKVGCFFLGHSVERVLFGYLAKMDKGQYPLHQFPHSKPEQLGDFPIASPQQVSNFPVANFPKIHYNSFPVASS